MRRIAAGLVCLVGIGGTAFAQGTSPEIGYVQGVAQSAFGNVTSQSFGVEAGWFVTPAFGIFAEGGQVRDTAPSELGAAAQRIAGSLAQTTASSIGYSVRQPVTFGAAGVRYAFAGTPKLQPYVLAGAGVASVKHDVTFTAAGTDITSNLAAAPYYTTLGSDLTGSVTKPMIVVGGGVNWRTFGSFRVDLGYRYTRIMTDVSGTTVNRAGLGLGITF